MIALITILGIVLIPVVIVSLLLALFAAILGSVAERDLGEPRGPCFADSASALALAGARQSRGPDPTRP